MDNSISPPIGRPEGSISLRKIRKIASDKCGNRFAISVSTETAILFQGIKFQEVISGNCIMFVSGAR